MFEFRDFQMSFEPHHRLKLKSNKLIPFEIGLFIYCILHNFHQFASVNRLNLDFIKKGNNDVWLW